MHVVLLLHDRGKSGRQWDPLVEVARGHPHAATTRFIFPLSPTRQWYQMEHLQDGSLITEPTSFISCVAQVQHTVMELVAAGINPDHIVVGGAGQGGAIALGLLLLMPNVRVGGVLCFGSHVPVLATVRAYVESNGGGRVLVNRDTPVYFSQGGPDHILTPRAAETTRRYMLDELGFSDWQNRVVPDAAESEFPVVWSEVWEFIVRASNRT